MALEFRRLLEVPEPAAAGPEPAVAGPSDEARPAAVVLPGGNKRRQPDIGDAIHRQAEEAYRKLLNSAYLLAVDGQPLSTFKTLVRVQKANGIKLIQGTDSSNKAREFVNVIADTVRATIATHLSSASAFSVLSDGSQARKTGGEKELVLVRLMKDGVPTYFTVALVDMDAYGDANAANLKTAIDDVFVGKVAIPPERYTKPQVAATADGAAVNTGIYNGLLTKMKASGRPWLLTIHCLSHRLELAIKDSLLKHPEFVSVKDIMITIFYVMKQSGKFKRQFHATAEALGVQVYTFPKVHGTRFVNHQRNGVRVLLHNWISLMEAIENAVAHEKGKTHSAKLMGILKKLRDVRFLSAACLFKAILDIVARLSLKFEEGSIVAFEAVPVIAVLKADLDDLASEDVSPIIGNEKTVVGGEITYRLPKPGHMKRLEENREYVVLTYSKMISAESATTVNRLKTAAVHELKECVDTRFLSFDAEGVYAHMHWVNPAHWQQGCDAEVANMEALAAHFETTLAVSGYDGSKLKREWRNLKQTVNFYYRGVKSADLWERILTYRRADYVNVCLLVEVVLAIGLSNSTVEAGFSFLSAMLSDRRLSLRHDTMEDLLIIKANDRLWTATERDAIIDSALTTYMAKRRKLKLQPVYGGNFGMLGEAKRKRRDSSEESSSSSDSDSDMPLSDDTD